MRTYNVDYAGHAQEELQLMKETETYKIWRVYFNIVEDEEAREETTQTVIEYFDEVNEETGETNRVPREIEKTTVHQSFSSNFIEVQKPANEEVTALGLMKEVVLKEVASYDISEEVNSFFLMGQPVWLDKDTRVGLMNSTTIQKTAGQSNTTLWFGGNSFTLPCDTVIQLLGALEIYALECYNKTAEHKKAVESLETVEEVFEYDYTTGYPEKLNINV